MVKFLGAMMGNSLRLSFVTWKDATIDAIAIREEIAAKKAANDRAAANARAREAFRASLHKSVVALCGERNGFRAPTYSEAPAARGEARVQLALDKLWPAMDAERVRLLSAILAPTPLPSPTACPVTTLSLAQNALGPSVCTTLCAALPQYAASTADFPRLRKLAQVAQEILSSRTCACRCGNLTSLDLRSNSLCDGGANALAAALVRLPSLAVLHLADNRIDDEGAMNIAGALPQCGALVTLGLAGNGIGDAGVEALAAMLPETKLRRLELDGNAYG